MTRHVLALALVLASTQPASAQDAPAAEDAEEEAPEEEAPQNVMFADLSLGVVALGYERVLDPRVAIQIAAGIYGPWYVVDGMRGVGGEARVFLFMEANAPFGFYVSPGVRGGWVQAEEGQLSGGAFSARLSFGYSVDLSPIVIRLGGGAQYHVVELDEPETGPQFSFHGVFGVLDIYVGWAF